LGKSIPVQQFPGHTDNELSASLAAQILKDLLSRFPRYRQKVNGFDALACLESDITFLHSLEAEAEQGFAEELRAAEQRVTDLRAANGKYQRVLSKPGNIAFSLPVRAAWLKAFMAWPLQIHVQKNPR